MVQVPNWVGWPLVAACGAGAFWFVANRAIYHPFKYPQGFWDLQDALGARDVWLQTTDGVRLHAWWLAPPNPRLATLHLHGNGGNLTHRVLAAGEIVAAGSAVLLLDYRGYGKSQGRPTEKGLYADADSGYAHLVALGFPPDRIIIHGESLGTAVAVDLAARNPCAGLILEAPFTSAPDVAARVLPVLGPLTVRGFDSRAKIGRVHAPLLVIHGDRDEIIPYDLGRALYEAANQPKRFFTAKGSGHNNIPETQGYRRQLQEFYVLATGLQLSDR